MSAYADDVKFFVRDAESLQECFRELGKLADVSALKVNKDKTEILKLGQIDLPPDFSSFEKNYMKITGIYHGNSRGKQTANDLNAENCCGKMETAFNLWRS